MAGSRAGAGHQDRCGVAAATPETAQVVALGEDEGAAILATARAEDLQMAGATMTCGGADAA